MQKHKTKIISTLVIAAILTGAWFYGGSRNVYTGDSFIAPPPVLAATDETHHETAAPASPQNETTVQYSAAEDIAPIAADPILAEQEHTNPPAEDICEEPDSLPHDELAYEPAITENPLPVEPQDMVISDDEFTVTLSVRCDTILNNMHLLNREKHELIPPDGIIFPPTVVTAFEGESVFNVLQREMRRAGIHMAFRNTPMFNSAYVMGINNIYEFDVGELSGWMYSVNGWFPNFGSSRYLLSPGDVIEWIYTCDLGRDIGAAWTGGQRDD